MKGYLIFFSLLLIVGAIMAIATCSIGIQCYNKCDNPNMNKEHPKNKIFLIINLILSILFLFASFFVFQFVMTLPPLPDISALTGGGLGGLGKLGGGGLKEIGGQLGKLLG